MNKIRKYFAQKGKVLSQLSGLTPEQSTPPWGKPTQTFVVAYLSAFVFSWTDVDWKIFESNINFFSAMSQNNTVLKIRSLERPRINKVRTDAI